MHPDDDTIRTNAQAREDAAMAMLEAGQLPGLEWHGDNVLEAVGTGRLLVHRVQHHQAMGGGVQGALTALWLMRHIPPEAHGQLMLTFDGWADDPRELHKTPQVVEFCQGMLLGADEKPNLEWGQHMLSIMIDERTLGLLTPDGEVSNPEILGVTGGLWLVAHAHPSMCFQGSKCGTIYRDLGANLALWRAIAGGDRE